LKCRKSASNRREPIVRRYLRVVEDFQRTLLTSCGCEKTVLYQRSNDGRLYRDSGEWEPKEPHLETDFVAIEKHPPLSATTGEITGDAHREIEGQGRLDDFISSLLDGETIAAAAARFVDDPA